MWNIPLHRCPGFIIIILAGFAESDLLGLWSPQIPADQCTLFCRLVVMGFCAVVGWLVLMPAN